ncbi:MAG: hypothetical protein M3159_02655 [Actinomycetota bacterium]|nr:hypothetical protein [Actinomycetota bacterium]
MPKVNRSRRKELALATLTVLGVVTLGATLIGPGAGADTTGAPDPVVKASISGGQTDVTPPGPLTGVQPGGSVHVNVVAGAGSSIFEVKARLCKPNVSITSSARFSPTQFGNCIAAPFTAGTDDDFVDKAVDSPFTTADLDFRVGAGTQTFDASQVTGGSSTITCGVNNPCALWLAISVPVSVQASGNVYKHYDINYAGSSATSSTTSTTLGASTTSSSIPSETTTSTTVTGETTTSSTAPGETTTSSSSTTLKPSDVTVTPSTVAPGGTIDVSSAKWKASSVVTVVLHSDPVTLGTLTADASGAVTGSFTIPAATAIGDHTIELTGTGTDDAARTVSTSLTVADASTSTTTSGTTTDPSSSGSTSGSALARTGFEVLGFLGIAAGLFGAGTFLVSAARRRYRRS